MPTNFSPSGRELISSSELSRPTVSGKIAFGNRTVSRTGKMARLSKSADFLILSLIFRHPRTDEFGWCFQLRVCILPKASSLPTYYHARFQGAGSHAASIEEPTEGFCSRPLVAFNPLTHFDAPFAE